MVEGRMTNRIFCVTLAFNPPGPLHSSMLIAPDETMAAAMAMQMAMAIVPEHASLVGTTVFAVDPDVLRQMLRAVEGKGPGEVVSLVPKPALEPDDPRRGAMANTQRAAEILRQHPDDDLKVDRGVIYGGEQFGPPMEWAACSPSGFRFRQGMPGVEPIGPDDAA
jgi:hypothetical protein